MLFCKHSTSYILYEKFISVSDAYFYTLKDKFIIAVSDIYLYTRYDKFISVGGDSYTPVMTNSYL